MFSNVNFRQQTGEFAWDEETQGHVLAAYYYGYVATQLMGGRLSEKMGAKMVYGTGIMLSGVFTLMGPVAARAKFYAFIAIRVLTGAASVWPMFKKWGCPERVEKYESSVGLRPIFSRCYIPLSDHHLFLQAQTNFEKNGHLFTYTDLLPITGPSTPIIGWVRGKSTTELNVRRPLRCERDFCSSGMLRSVDRLLGYRRFGTTYQVVLTAWPLEMGRIGFPETSVNYQSMLRNIPEGRGSQNKT